MGGGGDCCAVVEFTNKPVDGHDVVLPFLEGHMLVGGGELVNLHRIGGISAI